MSNNNNELTFTEQLLDMFPKNIPELFSDDFWKIVYQIEWDRFDPLQFEWDRNEPSWTPTERAAMKYALCIYHIILTRTKLLSNSSWDINEFYQSIQYGECNDTDAYHFLLFDLSFFSSLTRTLSQERDRRHSIDAGKPDADRTLPPYRRTYHLDNIPFPLKAQAKALEWYVYGVNRKLLFDKTETLFNVKQKEWLHDIRQTIACRIYDDNSFFYAAGIRSPFPDGERQQHLPPILHELFGLNH